MVGLIDQDIFASALSAPEIACLRAIMSPGWRELKGAITRVTCDALVERGLCHVISVGPDYWAAAQTPEEADAGRTLLIHGYPPNCGPAWVAYMGEVSANA